MDYHGISTSTWKPQIGYKTCPNFRWPDSGDQMGSGLLRAPGDPLRSEDLLAFNARLWPFFGGALLILAEAMECGEKFHKNIPEERGL